MTNRIQTNKNNILMLNKLHNKIEKKCLNSMSVHFIQRSLAFKLHSANNNFEEKRKVKYQLYRIIFYY